MSYFIPVETELLQCSTFCGGCAVLHKVCARWVPHMLSEDQKAHQWTNQQGQDFYRVRDGKADLVVRQMSVISLVITLKNTLCVCVCLLYAFFTQEFFF